MPSDFSALVSREVASLAREWRHTNLGDAFTHWSASLLLQLDAVDAYDATDVGGAHDHGLDCIWIDDEANTVDLMQAKYSESGPATFPETVVVDSLRCLRWLKEPAACSVSLNRDFRRASKRYRDAMEDGYDVRLSLVIFGGLSKSAKTQVTLSSSELASLFPKHTLYVVDISELEAKYIESIALEKDFEETVTLQVKGNESFDRGVGPYQALVATVPARALTRIYAKHGRRLFTYNVRFYLTTTRTNKQIEKTLGLQEGRIADIPDKQLFWHLNNGVSIVCKGYRWIDPGHKELEVSAPQIVNGCQTVATLYKAEEKGVNLEGVDVLVRFIKSTDLDFSLKITTATNTQNPNTFRDLASNDQWQIRLQGLFAALDPPYFYERKRREFENLPGSMKLKFQVKGEEDRTVDNRDVAAAFLSFALQNPTEARTRPREHFDLLADFYREIFASERSAEEYLLPTLLMRRTEQFLRAFRKERAGFLATIADKREEQLSQQEKDGRDHYNDRRALPYAKTQIVGLLGHLVLKKHGVYDSCIAQRLLEHISENSQTLDDLIAFCEGVIVAHTREQRGDFDPANAYKREEIFEQLKNEADERLEDPYYSKISPLGKIP